MDINKIRSKKYLLEQNILKFVRDAVNEFKQETHVSPNDIRINMLSIEMITGRKDYIVEDCQIDVKV